MQTGIFNLLAERWLPIRRLSGVADIIRPAQIAKTADPVVAIDWPQIVDVIGNPQGFEFLNRDVANVCSWFARKGVVVDPEDLFGRAASLAASSEF